MSSLQAAELLVVDQLDKSYTTADGELSILKKIHLRLSRGQAVAITGPSGSGKSTLLYILGALDTPTGGSVTLAGQNPFALKESDQAKFRNTQIGFVFQDHHLLPQCTVLENVLLPLLASQGIDSNGEKRARDLLTRVGLSSRLSHRPSQLSGGERQRAAVCRALITQPSLLLADEPTGNLDRVNAESVGSLLLELNQEQNTVLVCVTHSLDLANRFPQQYVLHDGTLESVSPTLQNR